MAHGKETPRQKMIGMMYLVLTALLALNVQKSVLDAFANVDHGISKIMHNFVERNNNLYDEFREKKLINEVRVGPFYDKALEVKEKADKIYEEIRSYKELIVTKADKDTIAIENHEVILEKVNGKDNLEIPAQIMVTEGRSKELKKNIDDFREFLIETVGNNFPEIIKSIEKNLNTEPHELPDGTKHAWESANFEHLPLAGVIAIMTGIQTDVRNSESEVINHLYNQIEAGSFKFNKLEPVVIPNSNYVIKGNNYEAKVFLAAYDTTQKPTIYVGNYEPYEEDGVTKYRMIGKYDSLKVDESGKGIFKRPGNSLGNFSWGGLIKLRKPDGGFIEKPFKESYQISESSVVVSPTKMNVFYQAVENPVEISVAGVPSDKVFVDITNATIKKKSGSSYVVSPRRIGDSRVIVSAEIDGVKRTLDTKIFRVEKIPDPVAKVAGKIGGGIVKNVLLAQTGIQADLENFVFDIEYKVIEFTVAATVKGFYRPYPATGNNFTPEQRGLIESLSRGQKLYIEDIKAIGPDGSPRDLPAIAFLIQ